jgi:hypothetical protein
MMNDRLNAANDLSPVDSRANLFYFLRIMSVASQIGSRKVGVDSFIPGNQVSMPQNATMRENQDRLAL